MACFTRKRRIREHDSSGTKPRPSPPPRGTSAIARSGRYPGSWADRRPVGECRTGRIAFPDWSSSGGWMRLASTYRCGGSTGMAKALSDDRSRTCFPFNLPARFAFGHLKHVAPGNRMRGG
ncbi:Uncharacterized protein pbN1_24620 [Aromatoleum bremense]|uniref:Uncharacterized protein n=1 Tax=Aromatoleum aromaticum (strain DSM 19018 / LMG 30748 / EbN1) TaxID=76114 RepID=Q5P2R2_AROAE|nr:Uncharacterized protein pbN1_24620 [Aromatoleum bremense]CAI08402.1 hypothetical protein ebA4012 [Aromatoleum aromaticum EbN1]